MNTKLLKKKILDLAIRGKLVSQDPKEEPASVLLERIKKEKERLIAEGRIKRAKKFAQSSNKPHYENEVPMGWICCRFDDLCVKFSTGPFGTMVHKSDYVETGGTPLINPANIIDGSICDKRLMRVNNVKAEELERYKLNCGDILIARRGDLSKCAIVSDKEKNWLCGTGSFFLHVPFVLPRYIEIFYTSEYVQSRLKQKCVGATMDNLNQSVLGSIIFLLPPVAEQLRIVDSVERWFSVVDALENETNELSVSIQVTKSKILDLAIHGKLVPQDSNDEPAIELLKRINPKFTPFDSHYEKLPIGWAVCRLVDIIDYEQPTRYIVESTNYSDEYKIPVLTAGKSFILGYTNETTGIYNKLPTIIFDDFTTDSRLVDFPFKVKSSAMKILQVNKEINIHYVAFFMSTTRLVGDTHKRYWISEYSKIPIPLPPINEQNRIVEKIEKLFSQLDNISIEL